MSKNRHLILTECKDVFLSSHETAIVSQMVKSKYLKIEQNYVYRNIFFFISVQMPTHILH